MAINKPPTPNIPYFSTAMYWVAFITLVTFIPMWYNTEPAGDLPMVNWLWWIGFMVVLPWGAQWVRVRKLRKSNTPKWNCPDIEPWSEPLQMSQEKYAGGSVEFWTWYTCSSGLTMDQAEEALKDPARKHQVEHEYSLYLSAYEKEYGTL